MSFVAFSNYNSFVSGMRYEPARATTGTECLRRMGPGKSEQPITGSYRITNNPFRGTQHKKTEHNTNIRRQFVFMQ